MQLQALKGLDGAHQPLGCDLDPGLRALAAETVDLELVVGRSKAVLGGHHRLDPMNVGALELEHLPAVEANEMLVNGLRRETVFVALEPLAEVVLSDELALDQ